MGRSTSNEITADNLETRGPEVVVLLNLLFFFWWAEALNLGLFPSLLGSSVAREVDYTD